MILKEYVPTAEEEEKILIYGKLVERFAKSAPLLDGYCLSEDNCSFFTFKDLGLAVIKNPVTLTYCGYVCVPKQHPWYKVQYSEIKNVNIHGGLTYSAMKHPLVDIFTDMWWVGFDCAHSGDIVPIISGPCRSKEDTYKDMKYTFEEAKKLLEQARDVYTSPTNFKSDTDTTQIETLICDLVYAEKTIGECVKTLEKFKDNDMREEFTSWQSHKLLSHIDYIWRMSRKFPAISFIKIKEFNEK